MTLRGSCLCDAVRYEVEPRFDHFIHCHCSRCRKATGNAVVPPERFRWRAGEDNVVRYDLPSARSFASSFCKSCGSPMPHLTRSGTRVIVPAGSLDDDPGVKPDSHVYWASRAAWYEVDPDMPKVDEAGF